MRLWSVLFCVIGCLNYFVLTQNLTIQKRSVEDLSQHPNEINDSSSSLEGRGLWDRFSNIFRSIYDYFGFSKARDRESRGSSIVRRPEMLPFEMQNLKNRRSGLEAPNGYHDQNKQFPGVQTRISSQKQKLQKQMNRFDISNKLEPPSFRTDEPTLRFDQMNRRNPVSKEKSNFMIVHVKDEKKQVHPRQPTKTNDNNQQLFSSAKVESREPLVSVYNKGIPTTKKSPPKAVQKPKPSSSVHSKFSLDKYSKTKEDPYWNDPIISNNRQTNSFIVTSSFSHGKQENVPSSGNSFAAGSSYQDRKPISKDRKQGSQKMNSNLSDKDISIQKKEWSVNSQDWNPDSRRSQNNKENNSNVARKQRYRNYYERDTRDTSKTIEQDMKPFFASPQVGDAPSSLSSQRNEKRKGLIGSMTNFASSFFSNLLPKTPSSKPVPGTSLNPPPPQAFHSLPSTNHESIEKRSPQINSRFPQLQKPGTPNHNGFAPSPLQGSMKVDAFQPIFIPSPSLDSNFPSDAMKPMILPQKRNVLTTPAPAAPQLIDFF